MIRKYTTRNTQHATRSFPLWTLLLVVLLASAQLWGPGMVNTRGGGDSPFLIQRLHQMTANLRAGVFPARWMPDAAYGLGYPFFNHYSALPFYLASSFNLLGLDPLTALKLTQTLGFLFAALATYGWVKHHWGSRVAAWLAAVAYTVAPFHLVNVYVRGDSLSEFYAFVFYPLILWALERVVKHETGPQETGLLKKTRFLDVVLLTLAYAGLILSHNISAFIFTPFAALYLILLVFRARQESNWIKPLGLGVAGLLLGAALSAWAWLPALLERDYVQPGTLTLGYFEYANHFRTANLVQLDPFFDYSIAVSLGGPSPFAMGGPQALVALAGLLALLRYALGKHPISNNQSPHLPSLASVRQDFGRAVPGISNIQYPISHHITSFVFPAIGLLLATAMITPLSRPLWEHVPLLALVQFPWRFLSVQALFAAVAAAALTLRLKGRSAWGVAGGLAVLLVASTLLPLRPERLLIGPDDVTTVRLQEYELFTGNIGTSITWEWLPRDTVPRPFTSDAVIEPDATPQPIPLAGELVEANRTQRRPTERLWRVQTGDDGATLAFPLLYWHGWRAWVDGAPTPTWAVEGAGFLALDVPSGEHTVRLKLTRTLIRAGAETVSLITLLILLVFLVLDIRCWGLAAVRYAISSIQYLIPFLLVILFLAAQSSPPPNHPGDLTMDFVARPYLHHNPDGADLGPARLLSYNYSADQLVPGGTLVVTLNWDSGQSSAVGGPVSLRLVSPAEHLPDLKSGPYALAEDSAPLEATTVHRLSLPENTPRGLYLVQVRLEETDLGPFYLRPVRVTQGVAVPPDAPVLALVGPDIRLHAAEISAGGPHLRIDLEWSTVRRLAANYQVSVRLLDPDGQVRASLDTQPGYGFAPTSLWRPGERVADRYNLPLPDDLPPGGGYRLLFVFYRLPSTAEVARVALGPFALPLDSAFVFEPPGRLFELPPLSRSLDVNYGDQVRLAGYDLTQGPREVELTLWWVAQQQPPRDYTAFVHLFDPATNAIPVQHDAMPRQGGYPTSGWLPGEVISDTASLALSDVPPGSYRLAVGLYEFATGDRLPAMTPDGAILPDGRLILPDEIEVSGE